MDLNKYLKEFNAAHGVYATPDIRPGKEPKILMARADHVVIRSLEENPDLEKLLLEMLAEIEGETVEDGE